MSTSCWIYFFSAVVAWIINTVTGGQKKWWEICILMCHLMTFNWFSFHLQIVGWADMKESVCDNPYKFTCGNFINQYKSHDLYLVNKGEWGANSHFEYEGMYFDWPKRNSAKITNNFFSSKDLNAVNSFISKLPNLPSRSSIQPMIKKIYSICMNIRSEERTSENLQVLKTILESAREYNHISLIFVYINTIAFAKKEMFLVTL